MRAEHDFESLVSRESALIVNNYLFTAIVARGPRRHALPRVLRAHRGYAHHRRASVLQRRGRSAADRLAAADGGRDRAALAPRVDADTCAALPDAGRGVPRRDGGPRCRRPARPVCGRWSRERRDPRLRHRARVRPRSARRAQRPRRPAGRLPRLASSTATHGATAVTSSTSASRSWPSRSSARRSTRSRCARAVAPGESFEAGRAAP